MTFYNDKDIVDCWFEKWEEGQYLDLPITKDFLHISPFGTIKSKRTYLELVKSNPDKFLGYRFKRQDEIYGHDKACVRYKAIQGEFHLDVTEWYYFAKGLIAKIVSYYHIGEIRTDRQLKNP